MDKEVAKSLLDMAVSLDKNIGNMFAEARRFSNDELRTKYTKATEDLMGYIARDVIFPIVTKYPDLDPDK